MDKKFILASQSPFRAKILHDAGLKFTQKSASIDERALEEQILQQGTDSCKNETYENSDIKKENSNKSFANSAIALPALADAVALALAKEKALSIADQEKDAYILGCDQILTCDGQILHKVESKEQAYERIKFLSGKSHFLHSAFALCYGSEILAQEVIKTELLMRPLSEKQCAHYIDKMGDKILSSVGCYQIEKEGINLFEKIEGDYLSIIGLPLLPLLKYLRHLNLFDL